MPRLMGGGRACGRKAPPPHRLGWAWVLRPGFITKITPACPSATPLVTRGGRIWPGPAVAVSQPVHRQPLRSSSIPPTGREVKSTGSAPKGFCSAVNARSKLVLLTFRSVALTVSSRQLQGDAPPMDRVVPSELPRGCCIFRREYVPALNARLRGHGQLGSTLVPRCCATPRGLLQGPRPRTAGRRGAIAHALRPPGPVERIDV